MATPTPTKKTPVGAIKNQQYFGGPGKGGYSPEVKAGMEKTAKTKAEIAARSKAKTGREPSRAAVEKTYQKWHVPKPKAITSTKPGDAFGAGPSTPGTRSTPSTPPMPPPDPTRNIPADNRHPKATPEYLEAELRDRQARLRAATKTKEMAGVAARSRAKYGKAPSKKAVLKTYNKWHAPKKRKGPKPPMTKGPSSGEAGS
jgi:hypothetical protein